VGVRSRARMMHRLPHPMWNFAVLAAFHLNGGSPANRSSRRLGGISLRILLTGSSGFIGSALACTLASASYVVRAVSRRRTSAADLPGVEWMELPDLEGEVDWAPLLADIDVVIHLAAIAHRSHVDEVQYSRIN